MNPQTEDRPVAYPAPGSAPPSGHPADAGGPGISPDLRSSRPLTETRRKSPVLAAILSALPGLGQVYVGHYMRGFIHIVVVGMIITVLNSGWTRLEPLLGIFLSFFWLYNVVDAARLATFYNEAVSGMDPDELRRRMVLPSRDGSLFGGAILIVVGVLLLSHTLFDVPLDWVENWWPVIPVLFGIYLIYKGIKERGGARQHS